MSTQDTSTPWPADRCPSTSNPWDGAGGTDPNKLEPTTLLSKGARPAQIPTNWNQAVCAPAPNREAYLTREMPRGADITCPPTRRGPTKQPPRPSRHIQVEGASTQCYTPPSGTGCPLLPFPPPGNERAWFNQEPIPPFQRWGPSVAPEGKRSLFSQAQGGRGGTRPQGRKLNRTAMPSSSSEADRLQHGTKSHATAAPLPTCSQWNL